MTEITITTVASQPYLYVERATGMDSAEVGPAANSGLGEVYAHMQGNGVPPAGSALVLYTSNDGKVMTYHVGFEISPEDMDKGHDQIKAGETPSGKVVTAIHKGSYAGIKATYGALMAHMKAEGLEPGGMCWELYLNDPSGTPEDQLRTKIFFQIK